MQWTLFATLYENIAPPMLDAVAAMITALQAWIAPVLRDSILLFVVLKLLWGTVKRDMEPISEFQAMAVQGMVVMYLATSAAGYGLYFSDLLLNGVSQQIGNALAGAIGNRTVSGGLFDELWNKAFVAGLAVYRNLPWTVAGFGLVWVVVLYWVGAAFGIGFAFLVWMRAFVFVALLVGLGPLFAGLWYFPLTRGWFFGWLNTTMSSVVLQILSTGLLTLILGATTRILAVLAATTGGASSRANEISQVQMLLGGIVLFAGCGWLALQLPGIAASITHGFTGFGHFKTGLFNGGGSPPAPSAPPAPAAQAPAPATRSVPMGAQGSPIPAPPPLPPTFRPMAPGPSISNRP